jgi:hypothetical protein
MRQQKKQIIIISGLLVIALIGLLVTTLLDKKPEAESVAENVLANHSIDEVVEIDISNQNDNYKVRKEGGGFLIEELPMDLINPDYLLMLLQEASKIEYLEVVDEQPQDLSVYGLDKPEAIVEVKYSDDTRVELLIGKQESISQNRYIKQAGRDEVLLKKNNQTIRFTMPLTDYFSLEIVPFSQTSSPLYAVQDITFSGTALKEPIEIEAVTADDEQTLRDASSFGATTHIIRTPNLHEVDQKEAIDVFSSVVGLLNEKVLAYNCTDEELAEYGFNNPYLQIEFDFVVAKNAPAERIKLRVVPYQDSYAVVRDDQRVVHLIRDEAFLKTDYSRLVLRWFFSPLITDIAKVEVDLDGDNNIFELSGKTNKELSVSLNGEALDIQQFREYYTLLISASNDGEGLVSEQPDKNAKPVLTIKYEYKDEQKAPDVLQLYEAGSRKLYASVNGITEFKMQSKYLEDVKLATTNLQN